MELYTGKEIPKLIADKFEFYNYNHAVEIMSQAFPAEWNDIIASLVSFKLYESDLSEAGGSETTIPGKLEEVLYPKKWRNTKISGDLHIQFYDKIIDQKKYDDRPARESIINGYVSEHRVDYLKGRVAFGLEWNKKDLAFDRTIADMKAFYECQIISAGIIMTRSAELNEAFKMITDNEGKPIIRKYGSSSTWMGKLLPRLDSRQAGGCPILAIGIKKACIEGYDE